MKKKGFKLTAIILAVGMVFGVLVACLPLLLDRSENRVNKVNTENVSTASIYYASATEETGASEESPIYKGGAIYLEANSTYTMKGGTIYKHKATYGGAVYVSNGATFTMEGGLIKSNTATYGGAIYVESGGICNITGGTISYNRAQNAPAIYVESGGEVNISEDTVIEKNSTITGGEYEVSTDMLTVGGIYGSTASTTYVKSIEFGSYPQTYVGDTLNAELETWYTENAPTSVKTYTTRENSSYEGTGTWESYLYTDGNVYARGISNLYSNSNTYAVTTYKDGTAVKASGTVVWFKVEPIKWLILNYDEYEAGTAEEMELFSWLVLTAYIPFSLDSTVVDANTWYFSNLRNWLNTSFYESAFSTVEQSYIQLTTVKNNVTNNYSSSTSDGSGLETEDLIYLKSYYEMNSGLFTSQAERLASSTDFAMSNYSYLNSTYKSGTSTYTLKTSYRAATTGYWLRSAGSSASYACYVLYFGYLYYYYTVTTTNFGVRPALHIVI